MSNLGTINWPGQSGAEYQHWIFEIGANFQKQAGNYIFAKETRPGYWSPVYVGQTKNLNQRLENHEKEECAIRRGATHIHAHLNSDEAARRYEELDLIHRWNPPCNDT